MNAVHSVAAQLLALIESGTPCIWLVVAAAQGSTPRETGASMLVTAHDAFGTIGGGHLELKAIEHARAMLSSGTIAATQRHYPLGPALGQCCGGAVSVLFAPAGLANCDELRVLSRAERDGGCYVLTRTLDTGDTLTVPLQFDAWTVWIFGAGHVGQAIVSVLAGLPCQVKWVDQRDAQFPSAVADNVEVIQSLSPADEVRHIAPGAQVLVLTHSHAVDLDICLALVTRDDLAYCGLIGSATKAAVFRKRFAQRGVLPDAIARIICPIGAAHLRSKHPGVIAVNVAMDLIEKQQQLLVTSAI
jgi:xanthine dehydrogenase accessory factor